MKLVQKLAVATAGVALSIALVDAKPTQAAVLNYDFTVEIDSTSSFLPGTKGSGSFSFDASVLNDFGSAPVKSLSFKFDGISGSYTEKDDLGFPALPTVFQTTFFSGGDSPIGLFYEFLNKATPSSSPKDFSIAGDYLAIYASASSNTQIGSGKVSYTQVPEPTAMFGLIIAGGIGCLRKKKVTALPKVKA